MNTRHRKRNMLAAISAILSFIGVAWAQQVPDSLIYTTGPFRWHEATFCNPTGSLTSKDPELSRRKNRDRPPPSYKVISVANVLQWPNADLHKRPRTAWAPMLREAVRPYENTGVTLEGYLVAVKHEEPEACNCDSKWDLDYHMWISATQIEANNGDKTHSVVAEISPRTLFQHQQAWNSHILNGLANHHVPVRMSGWLMWDEEHPDQIGVHRGTLWEVHPVHRIDVFVNGQWHTL